MATAQSFWAAAPFQLILTFIRMRLLILSINCKHEARTCVANIVPVRRCSGRLAQTNKNILRSHRWACRELSKDKRPTEKWNEHRNRSLLKKKYALVYLIKGNIELLIHFVCVPRHLPHCTAARIHIEYKPNAQSDICLQVVFVRVAHAPDSAHKYQIWR